MKRIQDLHSGSDNQQLNLRGDSSQSREKKESSKIKKRKNIVNKQGAPISQVRDLDGSEKTNYVYIRGKSFNPPKYLGNLLKVGLFGFLIIFIINALSVYGTAKKLEKQITDQTYEGYSYLVDAGKSATQIQFSNALKAFENAEANFSNAEKQLWFITTDNSYYGRDNNMAQAASSLLEGGKHFAIAGGYFLEAMEEFNKLPLYFVSKNTELAKPSPSITDSLKIGLEKTDLAIEEINLAAEEMAKINEASLPAEISARVTFAKEKIAEVSAVLNSTSDHFPAILKLLGDRYPHRYLILLQNNNEIRPTGGFIGSYAIVDVNEGYIENIEVHDVYDIDNSYGGIIEPPDELKAFTGNWRFRDSNYSPDFPTSAAKAKWFLEKEGGPSVDTVIAINQGLLKDLLEITGPIQVGDFGKLNFENYNLLLSYVIEGKVWGAEDPKHILKVFIPEFKKAIFDEQNISSVGSKLYKAVQQKHIMMYSPDADIENLFESLGVSGAVYVNEENEDYLSVINSSIGGTKSDQFVKEEIFHDTFIDEKGALINEVTIKRSHLWTDEIYLQWKRELAKYGFSEMPDQLIDTMGRGRNKVNVRIYVPAGSVLMESNGADVETKYDKDTKKTYFFTTMEAYAGETAEITIKYKLPFALNLNGPAGTYKLIAEKQPGSRGSILKKTIHAADGIENIAVYPEESYTANDGTITYPTNLVYDRYFSSVWER